MPRERAVVATRNPHKLRELGEISRAVGNAGAARSALREAVDSYQHVGASQEIAEVEAELDSLAG